MVDEPAFYYINKLVVAAWVSGQDEETRVNQVANRVVNDPFHNFAVAKLKPHPDSVNDGCARMEVEMVANRVPFKAVYIENGLDVADRNFLDEVGIEAANSKGLESFLGSSAQQLFDGVPSRGFQVAFDGPGAELDHNLFRLGCIGLDHEQASFLIASKQATRYSSGNVSS